MDKGCVSVNPRKTVVDMFLGCGVTPEINGSTGSHSD